MLLGRRRECDQLDRLLSGSRGGQGDAVVVLGEPGIGKTALLEYAVTSADDFRVLRTVGNEAERELPFAALQQLCAPCVVHLDELAHPQRDALRVAFGLAHGPAPDRLLVGLAALNLLARFASDGPLLCVVDDAQWLDHGSAHAFGFVARRLANERVALVFAARTVLGELRGLPELVVDGLHEADALELLRSALSDRVDDKVLDRIVVESRGNPLALLELPRGLTPAKFGGGFALPVSLPVAGRVEASFRRRLGALSAPSRRLLLVAAAEPTGDPALVWRAAEGLGVDESAAIALEGEGLLELSPRVVFRHPLVRSAAYGAAQPDERRAADRAIAEATNVDLDPDRRGWHRAEAAARPDEDVARELETSAARAQARGGLAAAAAFLQRSPSSASMSRNAPAVRSSRRRRSARLARWTTRACLRAWPSKVR